MISLSAEEIKIVRHWSENAQTSPFPQEKGLIQRLQRTPASRAMHFSRKEIEVILFWAEQETKGHYGTERYLLEPENRLLNKIESYLDENSE